MKTITLSRGYITKVDDEDYERFVKFKWHTEKARGNLRYAARCIWIGNKNTVVLLHRLIMDNPKGKSVDHVNGDGLDNRKNNLRICSHKENIRNSKLLRSNNKSGYRGVSWESGVKKWRADITVNYRLKFLGFYKTKELAAEVYNLAAKRYFKKYANINTLQ